MKCVSKPFLSIISIKQNKAMKTMLKKSLFIFQENEFYRIDIMVSIDIWNIHRIMGYITYDFKVLQNKLILFRYQYYKNVTNHFKVLPFVTFNRVISPAAKN